MATKHFLDKAGLEEVAGFVNEKLKVVSTMPLTPTNGQVVLYVGETTSSYTQGGIYMYDSAGAQWNLISAVAVDLTPYKKIFVGNSDAWTQLSTAEKKEYDEADITDDVASGSMIISDSVTEGDMNPATSNAVFNTKVKKKYINVTYDHASKTVSQADIGIDVSRIVSAYYESGATGVTGYMIGVVTSPDVADRAILLNLTPENGATYPVAVYYI